MKAKDVIDSLKEHSSEERRKANMWFFKTGPGEYGEGDKFIGVRLGPIRGIAKRYREIPMKELNKIIRSPYHEIRLTGVIILVIKYQRANDEGERKLLVNEYLKALDDGAINNWDLVDSSAHKILGPWLSDKSRVLLYDLARSEKLWHQRASIIACFAYLPEDDFDDAIKLSEILVDHDHDLIHKAVGWVLREIGKRDQQVEEKFLKKHQKTMPRTMLRYAIEKFPEPLRQKYLKGIA